MASTIASPVDISGDAEDRPLVQNRNIIIPIDTTEDDSSKQTSVNTIGILCHICLTIFPTKKAFTDHYRVHKRDEAVFTCVVCKKQFLEYPLFRSHCYIIHTVKNKFKCQHCQKIFSKSTALTSHITLVHEFRCNICSVKLESKIELETHKDIFHKHITEKNAPPYKCCKCSTTIDSLESCKQHLDEHCELKYPCPICESLLSDKQPATEHLKEHFMEHTPLEQTADETTRLDSSIYVLGGILCCHCDNLFRNKAEVIHHFEMFHSDKTISYTCNVCNASYEKYHIFGAHCYNHYSKNRFACDQCNKTFSRLSLLVMHTEMFHMICSEEEKPFHCQECGRGFYTMLRIHEHRRLVHGVEDIMYRCNRPNCSNTFGKPRELIQHLAVHGSSLDRWCRLCGLHLPALASAERHLAVHRRAAYPCPVCAREYNERYRLLNHAASHFERVFHVCSSCGKAYPERHRFLQHMRMHDSRPTGNACSHCGKSFPTRLAVMQHENTHTGRRPFTCTECPKTFASYPNWRKHMVRVHRLPPATVRDIFLRAYQPDLDSERPRAPRSRRAAPAAPLSPPALHASPPSGNACSHCGKSFPTRLAVMQHENTHTGRRPFTCTECPKTFASYPNWRKHMVRVHRLPPATVRDIFLRAYQPDLDSERPRAPRSRRAAPAAPLSPPALHASPPSPRTPPIKPESGIESAGSELSDVHAFASDDSSDFNDWSSHIKTDTAETQPLADMQDPPVKSTSIAEIVRNCIDALDDNLQETLTNDTKEDEPDIYMPEPRHTSASIAERVRTCIHALDDSLEEKVDLTVTLEHSTLIDYNMNNNTSEDESDIRAIVEHIDALSGEMEAGALDHRHPQPQYPGPATQHYMFQTGGPSPGAPPPPPNAPLLVQAEYGPDFTGEAASLENLLPHINPLLTIKQEADASPAPWVQLHWPAPTITATKLCHYEQQDDSHSMYPTFY